MQCHHTQVQGVIAAMASVPQDVQVRLWGVQTLYRVYSLVNGGRQVEDDVFLA